MALALGDPERDAPEPSVGAVRGMDKVDASDIMIAIENVVVFLLRLPAFAGHLWATKDQDGVGHCKRQLRPSHFCSRSPTLSRSRPLLRCVPTVDMALNDWPNCPMRARDSHDDPPRRRRTEQYRGPPVTLGHSLAWRSAFADLLLARALLPSQRCHQRRSLAG
jgi:hypothetical protein